MCGLLFLKLRFQAGEFVVARLDLFKQFQFCLLC